MPKALRYGRSADKLQAMAKKKGRLKKVLIGVGCAIVLGAGFTWYASSAVNSSAEGLIFTEAKQVPKNRVALVLGTAPKLIDGRNNLYFLGRIQAAAELYKAGKVQKILASGDNGRRGYDEPTAMKEALIKRGVPAEDIALDFAGFKTLDSIVRAKKVFGLSEFTIITDDFHLPRALYIAKHEGIKAIGYQTGTLNEQLSTRMRIRESGARVLMFWELYVTRRDPKFLGKPETI